jgi:hypothetical protein
MIILVALAFVLVWAFIGSIPFWLIWNNVLVSAVDFANPITYVQAFWLCFLLGFFIADTSTKK